MGNYVVTIARGYGSGGKEIGDYLGKMLGIPCYEGEILSMTAKKTGIDQSVFEKVDEKLQGKTLNKILYNWLTEAEDDKNGKKKISGWKVFQMQSEVIRNLAETQSCIIVGKCADYILEDFPNTVSVYVEAPRWACLKRLTDKYGWAADEANSRLIKMDHQRSEYYKCYTGGKKWDNPTNYDLVLNSAKLGVSGSAKMIEACLLMKGLL